MGERARPTGGVDVWRQIARLKSRFEEDMRRMPALVERRLGKKRKVRIQGAWWCVRWQYRTYRAQTPAALLRALPKRGRPPATAEPVALELPMGAS